MKKISIILVVALAICAYWLVMYHHDFYQLRMWLKGQGTANEKAQAKDIYICPMHPQVTSDKPGECPICHMSLVKRAAESPASRSETAEKGKLLYYRNPMNPQVTSPVPMKDQMGMDYVAVYEEVAAKPAGQFYISSQKLQLIGVKTAKAEKRKLTGQIVTVGRVAYDPDLYVAQEEYLQAVKGEADRKDDTNGFAQGAARKLQLMGMSKKEIAELAQSGKPEEGLYLPQADQKNVWVYMTVYEYEAGYVKEGQSIEVTAGAYPGEVFKGKVVSIAPMVDAMTRSLKVRAMVDNPAGKLKLEMYVNAALTYDLGEKLAVPQDSVMNAGTRTYVFTTDGQGHFKANDVKLGARADGWYEVLSGLAEGAAIVTSGNFLIDSESKLSAVLTQMSEPNTVPARQP
jgi:Cu(I)/Ag(I) efflux system membrane fusion protein